MLESYQKLEPLENQVLIYAADELSNTMTDCVTSFMIAIQFDINEEKAQAIIDKLVLNNFVGKTITSPVLTHNFATRLSLNG